MTGMFKSVRMTSGRNCNCCCECLGSIGRFFYPIALPAQELADGGPESAVVFDHQNALLLELIHSDSDSLLRLWLSQAPQTP